MREYPWNVRRPSTQHYQRYRNLLDLHALTQQWLKDLNVERAPHLLKRGVGSEVHETLWMLENLAEAATSPNESTGASSADTGRGLSDILDDTTPDDVLGRLERTVYAVQAWTLAGILDRTPKEERRAILNQLEQSSWNAGRTCAQSRWPHLEPHSRSDLRGILCAFNDSPLAGAPERTFLIRRAVSDELILELRACPHCLPYPEVQPSAPHLCNMHAFWIRGFAYSLNTRISIEYTPQTENVRCALRWTVVA